MGTNTDAILAYGYDLLEDEGMPEDLLDCYGDLGDWLGQSADPAVKDYKEIRKLFEACPVDIIRHCSAEYPMFFLAIKRHPIGRTYSNDFEIRCSRGDLVPIDQLPCPTEEEIKALEDFVEKHGFKTSGKLGWHLMSWWS